MLKKRGLEHRTLGEAAADSGRVKICVAQGENASCYQGGEIAGGGDGAGESAGCSKLNGNEYLRGEQVTSYCDERRHCGVLSLL